MSIRQISLWQWELIPWYAFIAVWVVAALWTKRTKAVEPLTSRLYYGSIMAMGFALMFSPRLEIGVLKLRFLPQAIWIEIAGVALTFAGAALAIWARLVLGENWSARVTRKIGHELVKSGPYAFVRHPIYSGLTLAVIGTAVVVGKWRALLGIPLIVVSECVKAWQEERFMLAEFGDAYRHYRQETGFLVPGW